MDEGLRTIIGQLLVAGLPSCIVAWLAFRTEKRKQSDQQGALLFDRQEKLIEARDREVITLRARLAAVEIDRDVGWGKARTLHDMLWDFRGAVLSARRRAEEASEKAGVLPAGGIAWKTDITVPDLRDVAPRMPNPNDK